LIYDLWLIVEWPLGARQASATVNWKLNFKINISDWLS